MNHGSEYRRIMAGIVVVVMTAPLTAVWPVLDAVLIGVLVGVAGASVAGYWLRELIRELRFRRDMRALDARDAARTARTGVPA